VARFEDLTVYQSSVRLADDLHRSVIAWKSLDRWTVGVQLIRAADSIGANIAEGLGRSGSRDRRRMLLIARGSSYELQHWLARVEARCLERPDDAIDRANDVGRMLNGLIRSWSRSRS
jgi:four helix bundle protein